MRWNRRIGVGAALAVGVIGVTGGASLAALSKAQVSPGRQDASAVEVNGVKLSHAQSGQEHDESWSLIEVNGTSPLTQTATGWTGPAAVVGNLSAALNQPLDTGCTSGGVMVPVVNQNVRACGALLPTGVSPSDGYGSVYGAAAFAYVEAGGTAVAVTALNSQTESSYLDCDTGAAEASPVEVDVFQNHSVKRNYPAGHVRRGC